MKNDQHPSYNIASGICVEVGTWEGGFTNALLSKPEVTKVYCVDPYKHFQNNEHPDGMNLLTQDEFDTKYITTKTRLESTYDNKVEFIRLPSVDAAQQFKDESLDFVYIDGNHDYKYVLQDLRAWYPKIKRGGVLAGDDIYSTDLNEHDVDGNVTRVWGHDCWGKYGVYKAIVDFGKPFKIEGTQFSIFNN